MKVKLNKWGEPVVPCKYCAKDTTMTGTRMCDGCYELERSVRFYPELVEKMLKEIRK